MLNLRCETEVFLFISENGHFTLIYCAKNLHSLNCVQGNNRLTAVIGSTFIIMLPL